MRRPCQYRKATSSIAFRSGSSQGSSHYVVRQDTYSEALISERLSGALTKGGIEHFGMKVETRRLKKEAMGADNCRGKITKDKFQHDI